MLEYITYKGVKYPVRLSYRMFQGLKKDLGSVDLKKLQSLDADVIEAMLFHGLKSGCKREGIEFTFTREDMEEILDDCFFEFMKIVPKFFPKAKLGNGEPNLEQEGEEQTLPV